MRTTSQTSYENKTQLVHDRFNESNRKQNKKLVNLNRQLNNFNELLHS